MQLGLRTTHARLAGALALVACGVLTCSGASAQVRGAFSTTTTAFYESGGPLDMTVITPAAEASVDVGDSFGVRAGYSADIVSGASVAVVDGPSSAPDVVSSATKLDDIRHSVGGGLRLGTETTSLRANYNYGVESDYRSHSFDVTGRAELFERDTTLELTYARGFDAVCVLDQPRAQDPVNRQRLASSTGCFGTDTDRTTIDISLQTLQATWTQDWTSLLATQFSLSAQLIDGYQGNPYRGVWLGRTASMENTPEVRVRYAAGLGVRFWIKPLSSALQLTGRAYRDTWDVRSVTAEVAYEQNIASGLSLRARARFYTQSAAAFYSDDYSRAPRGEYFTGDRELSAMGSWTLGGRIAFDVPANDEGDVLGFLSELRLLGKADVLLFTFDDFHYGAAAVPNTTAIVATISLEAAF